MWRHRRQLWVHNFTAMTTFIEGEGQQGACPQGKHKMPPHLTLRNAEKFVELLTGGHEFRGHRGNDDGEGTPQCRGTGDE